jgi:hypothetical protein
VEVNVFSRVDSGGPDCTGIGEDWDSGAEKDVYLRLHADRARLQHSIHDSRITLRAIMLLTENFHHYMMLIYFH